VTALAEVTVSAFANPYLDAFLYVGGRRRRSEYFALDAADREINALVARRTLCLTYAWAVPDERALAALAALGPIVEIAAGGGYWARLLRERGVDVVAYDLQPRSNWWVGRSWARVDEADASAAGDHPDRALFLCWPPYDKPVARDALKAYLRAGGRSVAYVGEHEGGCCADSWFFRLLERRFVCEQELAIPQWPGIHDYLSIWRRR
jgi:hypothetical protein